MYFNLKNNQLLSAIDAWYNAKIFGLNQNQTENIKIALGEVLQNIMRHGYKNNLNEDDLIDIEVERVDDKLFFVLRDYAQPCKPETFMNKIFKPNESGHMGLSIIKKLTEEFIILPLKDGNKTRLVFKIGMPE